MWGSLDRDLLPARRQTCWRRRASTAPVVLEIEASAGIFHAPAHTRRSV